MTDTFYHDAGHMNTGLNPNCDARPFMLGFKKTKGKRVKIIKTIAWVIFGAIVIGLIGITGKTIFYKFPAVTVYKNAPHMPVENFDRYVQNLSGALKFATVSNTDYESTDFQPFNEFRAYVQSVYPNVFENVQYYVINDHAMLLHWPGVRSDLPPILFNAHYDVVPSGPVESWEFGPFSGMIVDGRIYGRGALDMKGMLFALMSSADNLMSSGFVPQRDIYFAFGHDEEVGAAQGSAKIAKFLQEKGVQLDAVFDEGGMITLADLGDNEYGAAFIGIAEKGLQTVQINVLAPGGHSSMPPAQSALGNAAIIMQRLIDQQMPARLLPVTENILDRVGSVMPFLARFLIANKTLLGGVLVDQMSKIPAANAMIRTTTALTQASGSDAYNVLPSVASVVVNFRILPGDTTQDVIDHVKKLSEDFDVQINIMPGRNPSAVSSTTSHAYDKVKSSILSVYPSVNIMPYITLGGTDSRNYEPIAANVYRFLPAAMTLSEQGLMHNDDESISLENYNRMILYFENLMRTYDQ